MSRKKKAATPAILRKTVSAPGASDPLPPFDPQNILTPEELAARLKVGKSWVYEKLRRRQRNPIPVYRVGRYLRFNWLAILAWLESTSNGKRQAGRRITL